MAEELGTRDVFEQVDTRLGNVEQDIRALRTEMNARFDRVYEEFGTLRKEMNGLRGDMNTRFEQVEQRFVWLYGLMVALIIGIAGLWFK